MSEIKSMWGGLDEVMDAVGEALENRVQQIFELMEDWNRYRIPTDKAYSRIRKIIDTPFDVHIGDENE